MSASYSWKIVGRKSTYKSLIYSNIWNNTPAFRESSHQARTIVLNTPFFHCRRGFETGS
jgi:hypothetical protein